MKHKRFNEILPYCYFLVRKEDNMKYVGARYGNVKKNLTPEEDFGRVYFTSGKLRKEFKENPEAFYFRLVYTFDDIEEMFEWERSIALRVYKREDWANQGWGTNYGDNPIIGSLISEGKNRVKGCGRTSVQIGAEALRDWVWNTPEGEEWREEISNRKFEFWANISEEERSKIIDKRNKSMDFQTAAEKAHKALSEIGEDGLTGHQRKGAKAHQTKLEKGIYEKQGKRFSEWCANTEEGRAYVERAREISRQNMLNLPEDIKKERRRKANETLANRSEKEKAATKAKAAATRAETNRKLGEMSEEAFEEFIQRYTKRGQSSARTRRRKYLEQIGQD